MSVAADATQSAEYWRLLEEVEAGVDDDLLLGAARQDVLAADLDEDDRLDLLGRIDQYQADNQALGDPVEVGARGDGPEVDRTEPNPIVGDEFDAPEDAALDREDGFEPVDAAPADSGS